MATQDNLRCAKCCMVVLEVFNEIMQELLEHRNLTALEVYDIVMNHVPFIRKLKHQEKERLQTLRTDGFSKLDVSIIYKIVLYFKNKMFIPMPTKDWGVKPSQTDKDIGDDVERIHLARNHFAHKTNADTSELEFEEYFNLFHDVGQRVDKFLRKDPLHGHARRIRDLKIAPMDTDSAEKYLEARQEIEQLKQELVIRENKKEVAIFIGKSVEEAMKKLKEIKDLEANSSSSRLKLTIEGVVDSDEQLNILENMVDELNAESQMQVKSVEKSCIVLIVETKSCYLKDKYTLLEAVTTFFTILKEKQAFKWKGNKMIIVITIDEEFEEHSKSKSSLVLNLEMDSDDLRDGKLNHQLSTFVQNLLRKSNGHDLFEQKHANASLVVEDTWNLGGKEVVALLPPSDVEYDTGDNWSTTCVLSEDSGSSISENRGKEVVALLPPSDVEYDDTEDSWSTASVLSEDSGSSISEDEENGADDTTVVENFEDKLKDCIEGISQKSGKDRISCIETMAKLLSKKYVYDFLSNRKVTVSDGLLECLKKGNGDEQAASAKCLSLLCVQLGNEIEDDFKEVHCLLLTILADNTAPVKARSECAATLAMSSFIACTDISVVDNTMLALENIFKGSYRKGDKSVPSHPQQISRLHTDALSAWSLLISITSTFSVQKKIKMHLSRLSDLLESADVELRIVAGETIALLYELAREEDEEYEGEDICTLCATLKNLATDSHKFRAKKNRKMQRSSFRDVLRAVEEGDEPDLAVKFGKECVMIDSWSKREQYDSLCQALTSGVNHHLQENPAIREIFGLGPPIPVGNVPPQKVSKWERTHYNAALFKARTKARSKHRDKRSVVMNGGD